MVLSTKSNNITLNKNIKYLRTKIVNKYSIKYLNL